MLDSITLGGCIVSILMYAVLFIYALYHIKTAPSDKVPIWVHFLILLFCIFSLWDTDYYHYQQSLSNLNFHYSFDDQLTHLEVIYIWLYKLLGSNYLMFRTFVWGVAYLFFVITAKRLRIYTDFTFSCFIILFLLTFSYARVSLGMASLFLGGVLISSNNKRMINLIVGIALLVLCFFSHKSMVVPMCLLPLCFIRYNRKAIPFVIFLVILFVIYYSDYISEMLFMNVDTMDDTSELYETFQSASGYHEGGQNVKSGMGALLQRILQYSSIFLPLLSMFNVKQYDYLQKNVQCRIMYNMAILISIVAVAMGILVSFSSALCYRYLYMAYIPIVLLLGTLYKQGVISTRRVFALSLLGGLSAWYTLLYVLYNQIVS